MKFFNSNINFKQFIEKIFEDQKYNPDYYYVSVKLEGECLKGFLEYQNLIPDEDIYTGFDNLSGRELSPHITIMYGLKEDCLNELIKFCNNIEEFTIFIWQISSFRTPETDYDVIISPIDDPDGNLYKLHNFCMQFQNEWSYDDYKPHATISYVNKDTCKEIEGNQNHRIGLVVTEISYLDPEGNETIIPLLGV